MKLALLLLGATLVASLVIAAEVRRADVPMDRLPWELAEPSLTKPDWWEAPHVPTDHPYWWTLTDELEPADLQERLTRRQSSARSEARETLRRRAQEATTPQEDIVVMVVDGRENPELYPAWNAFYSFAAVMRGRKTPTDQRRELEQYGLSTEAANQITQVADQLFDEAQKLWRESVEDGRRLRKLYDDIDARLPAEQLHRMRSKNELANLAAVGGVPEAELRSLLRRAHRDPAAAAAVPALVALRDSIGEKQYQLFRRYLLERIAPHKLDPLIFGVEAG